MSSSTSTSHSRWPRYGPVPMSRCPDCPRTAPLKRLVTGTDKNDNLGREFVKCLSKPEVGKDLRKCNHFEWLDEYVSRIGSEGASLGLNSPSAEEQSGCATPGVLASTVGHGAEVKAAELKQINKQLKKLVDLKKQDNLMAAIFNVCVIALGIVYLMIISR